MIRLIRIFNEWYNIRAGAPQDRPQRVFNLINLLGRSRHFKSRRKFLKEQKNKDLLLEEPHISDILNNNEGLKDTPKGTLINEYYKFINSEKIDYYKYATASESIRLSKSNKIEDAYDRREITLHDLIHIVFGYNKTHFGEGATLITQYWQGGYLGLGVIVFLGSIRAMWESPEPFTYLKALKDIYYRQKGIDFRSYPFEDNLLKNVQDIRNELGIRPITNHIKFCDGYDNGKY